MNRIIALVAGGLLLAGTGASAQTLSQGEVEEAIKGATFALKTQDGYTATIAFNADMTALLTLNDGSTDDGTYRFAEGGYCSTWEKSREGAEACFTIERLSDTEFQLYTLTGEKNDLFTRQ